MAGALTHPLFNGIAILMHPSTRRPLRPLLLLAPALLLTAGILLKPGPAACQGGTIERITVHGASLEGNLSGDSPDREVSVYLPPSYTLDPDRRYPVLYMLHGYTDDDARWFGMVPHWINFPTEVDQALSDPEVREMIIVMPNAYTRFQGSMYSNSVTTGNWEDFVARDLVGYVDGHYRTLPGAESRGLAGHSMGGYGTIRIGMKNPEVFSSIYALSPCCLAPRTGGPGASAADSAVEAIRTMEDFRAAGFGTRATIASAAAWAPNPENPPFFLDLPTKDGEPQPLVLARFGANAPLALVDQYAANLRRLRGIAIDAGDEDRGIAVTVRDLHQILVRYEIPHLFEIYGGDHLSGVAERIRTQMLPFFSRTLAFSPPGPVAQPLLAPSGW